MLLFVAAVILALLFSFVCSISEATLLSVTHAQVDTMAKRGSPAGVILQRM
jgi:CBS domain containing-hemolysin-like protein